MDKFCDVLSRWKARELSAQEAGELLGCSERQFRRYRRRYDEEGLQGVFDKRLGKASARRVPIDRVNWMLWEYRTRYTGWTFKHFHEHMQKQHNFRWRLHVGEDAIAYGASCEPRSTPRRASAQATTQALHWNDAAPGWQSLCVA
jgi:transposase